MTCSRHKGEIINSIVTTKDLLWQPTEDQAKETTDPYRPVHDDIVIARLKPGQSIHVECHAVKGLGKEHAKWSPVSTAFYRLKPQVQILEQIKDDQAQQLVQVCPMGVYDIEDVGNHKQAIVSRPQNCTVCRECIRNKDWESKIRLSRLKNHFTCNLFLFFPKNYISS